MAREVQQTISGPRDPGTASDGPSRCVITVPSRSQEIYIFAGLTWLLPPAPYQRHSGSTCHALCYLHSIPLLKALHAVPIPSKACGCLISFLLPSGKPNCLPVCGLHVVSIRTLYLLARDERPSYPSRDCSRSGRSNFCLYRGDIGWRVHSFFFVTSMDIPFYPALTPY